jgi:phosphopantetheinyl transferase
MRRVGEGVTRVLRVGETEVFVADENVRTTVPLDVLPEMERALVGQHATEKRRGDFVAGRRAARRAVRAITEREFVIIREQGEFAGRPRVVDASTLEPIDAHVSITHADGVAIAAAARAPVAIDLVTVESFSAAFIAEAFVGGERESWAALLNEPIESDRVAAAAFAAKEAVLKFWGVGLRESLQRVRVEVFDREKREEGLGFQVRANDRADLSGRFVQLEQRVLVFVAG